MLRLLICIPLLALLSCEQKKVAQEKVERPKVSYTLGVRPILINNCLNCHQDLPLHDPRSWDLLHPHDEFPTPELIKKWVSEGSQLDEHWALRPLRDIRAENLDQLIDFPSPALLEKRTPPAPPFTAPIKEVLAGDLLEDPAKARATWFLRQGKDTPESRLEKAASHFAGLRIECASCHHHPYEAISTSDYQSLLQLFTTPYPPGSIAPVYLHETPEISQNRQALLATRDHLLSPQTPDEASYQAWLAREGQLPEMPNLVGAYSFEGEKLENLLAHRKIREGGQNLIADNGVHGMGLFFEEDSEITFTDWGPASSIDPFTISLWIKAGPDALASTQIARIGSPDRGFALEITDGKLRARWARAWPQIALSATSKLPLIVAERWQHLVVSSDGSRKSDGLQIYLNGHLLDLIRSPDTLRKATLDGGEALTIRGKDLSLDELHLFDDALTPIEVRQLFDGRSLALAYLKKEDLRTFYLRSRSEATSLRREQLRQVMTQLLAAEEHIEEYPIMAALSDQPAPTQLPYFSGKNRLELAARLNENLAARSIANQTWAAHFGSPLVAHLGHSAPPSQHDDLLEFLARKLITLDWNPGKLSELIQESDAWQNEWTQPTPLAIQCPRPHGNLMQPSPKTKVIEGAR